MTENSVKPTASHQARAGCQRSPKAPSNRLIQGERLAWSALDLDESKARAITPPVLRRLARKVE